MQLKMSTIEKDMFYLIKRMYFIKNILSRTNLDYGHVQNSLAEANILKNNAKQLSVTTRAFVYENLMKLKEQHSIGNQILSSKRHSTKELLHEYALILVEKMESEEIINDQQCEIEYWNVENDSLYGLMSQLEYIMETIRQIRNVYIKFVLLKDHSNNGDNDNQPDLQLHILESFKLSQEEEEDTPIIEEKEQGDALASLRMSRSRKQSVCSKSAKPAWRLKFEKHCQKRGKELLFIENIMMEFGMDLSTPVDKIIEVYSQVVQVNANRGSNLFALQNDLALKAKKFREIRALAKLLEIKLPFDSGSKSLKSTGEPIDKSIFLNNGGVLEVDPRSLCSFNIKRVEWNEEYVHMALVQCVNTYEKSVINFFQRFNALVTRIFKLMALINSEVLKSRFQISYIFQKPIDHVKKKLVDDAMAKIFQFSENNADKSAE